MARIPIVVQQSRRTEPAPIEGMVVFHQELGLRLTHHHHLVVRAALDRATRVQDATRAPALPIELLELERAPCWSRAISRCVLTTPIESGAPPASQLLLTSKIVAKSHAGPRGALRGPWWI